MVTRTAELEKLKKYCAYQDRCHQEVRMKLISLQVYGDEQEDIIIELINEGFLNEERFAKSYARGKFKMKKWGRNRIKMELQRREISDYCIRKGLEEIEEEEYHIVLKNILKKRLQGKSHLGETLAKDNAIKFAASKGFEQPLIYSILAEMSS